MGQTFGMVHMRSQPFHNEHLGYILNALGKSRNLIIGITNPDPETIREETTSPHRHTPEANRWTYFQRMAMISLSLADQGVDLQNISIIPFDPTSPSKWPYYLPSPRNVIQYVRLFSSWEEKKAEIFQSQGFEVFVIDRRAPKNITGSQVRELMREGLPWKQLVPEGTQKVLHMIEEGLM
jgi:nicotinamide mononucleotide adenylyltransferase